MFVLCLGISKKFYLYVTILNLSFGLCIVSAITFEWLWEIGYAKIVDWQPGPKRTNQKHFEYELNNDVVISSFSFTPKILNEVKSKVKLLLNGICIFAFSQFFKFNFRHLKMIISFIVTSKKNTVLKFIMWN